LTLPGLEIRPSVVQRWTVKMRYDFYVFFISAPNRGEWLVSRLGRFAQGKNRIYPLGMRLGGPRADQEVAAKNKFLPRREWNLAA
jgi:hypothetical protein